MQKPEALYAKYKDNFISTVNSSEFYNFFMKSVKTGQNIFNSYQKYAENAIDPKWIEAIEKCIIPLDNIIRVPRKFIETFDEIVPIEQARKITEESIRHLAQHTNMIAKVDEDGSVTPNKILNIYKEETYATYENRFIYTLLINLNYFIDKRLHILDKAKVNTEFELNFGTEFELEAEKLKYEINISSIEKTERPDHNYKIDDDTSNMSLRMRIDRIRKILSDFQGSRLIKSLKGVALVRPPITKTNVLLKNPDFKQAMNLWTYIESYRDPGLSAKVVEKQVMPTDDYIEDLYAAMLVNYFIFSHYNKPNKEIDLSKSPDEENMPKFTKLEEASENKDEKPEENTELQQIPDKEEETSEEEKVLEDSPEPIEPDEEEQLPAKLGSVLDETSLNDLADIPNNELPPHEFNNDIGYSGFGDINLNQYEPEEGQRRRVLEPKIVRQCIDDLVEEYELDIDYVERVFVDFIRKNEKQRNENEDKIKKLITEALYQEQLLKLRKAEEEKKLKEKRRRQKKLAALKAKQAKERAKQRRAKRIKRLKNFMKEENEILKRKEQRELAKKEREALLSKEKKLKVKEKRVAKQEKELALEREAKLKLKEKNKLRKAKELEKEKEHEKFLKANAKARALVRKEKELALQKEKAKAKKEKLKAKKLQELELEKMKAKKAKAKEKAKKAKLLEEQKLKEKAKKAKIKEKAKAEKSKK